MFGSDKLTKLAAETIGRIALKRITVTGILKEQEEVAKHVNAEVIEETVLAPFIG